MTIMRGVLTALWIVVTAASALAAPPVTYRGLATKIQRANGHQKHHRLTDRVNIQLRIVGRRGDAVEVKVGDIGQNVLLEPRGGVYVGKVVRPETVTHQQDQSETRVSSVDTVTLRKVSGGSELEVVREATTKRVQWKLPKTATRWKDGQPIFQPRLTKDVIVDVSTFTSGQALARRHPNAQVVVRDLRNLSVIITEDHVQPVGPPMPELFPGD